METSNNPFAMNKNNERQINSRMAHHYSIQKKVDMTFNREVQTEAVIQDIFNKIPLYFLEKEYYPNEADGSNKEISNLVNHSPSDIKKRKEEGKGLFYMNSCISQTLYTINKIKETFPYLTRYMNLGIEFLQFVESDDVSVHAFIDINIPSLSPIIIDYARNNDVYIYKGGYRNTTGNIKSLDIISIPSNRFDENDSIIKIAEKSSDKIPNLDINTIKKMLNSRTNKLCKDNTGKDKFEAWKQENGNSPIYCFKNGKHKDGNTSWLRLKLESTTPTKFSIENGKDENGNTIWAGLKIEDADPPKIFMKNGDGYTDIGSRFHDKLISYLISHCN